MQVEHAFLGLGTSEVIVILGLALLLFGGKKIPELMRGLGQGVREFNAAKANIKTEIEEGMRNKPESVSTPATEEKKA